MMKPVFDEEAAKEMVGLCKDPVSKRPQEAGLRAVFAVMQSHLFDKAEEAWVYYGSTRQRFYEWKHCVTTAMEHQRQVNSEIGDGEAFDLLAELDQSAIQQVCAACGMYQTCAELT